MFAEITNYLAAAFVLAGGLFALAGALGVIRLPDVFARSHAASTAGVVGTAFALLAVAISADDAYVATRAVCGLLFLLLTAPLAAHLLLRAAYKTESPMSNCAHVEEMSKERTKLFE